MIKLRWPIYIVKEEHEFTQVSCFHCGKPFFIALKNIRTVNYCSGC
jgi:hypothetical protein